MKRFSSKNASRATEPTHRNGALYSTFIAIVFCITTAFCLATITLFPSPTFAATTPIAQTSTAPVTANPATAPQPNSDNIAAGKVDSFATAYLQVLQLLSDREPELPAAETSAEAQKIQQSIEAEAVALIKASGLSMPEYMEILGLASQDATFRDKILGRMDEAIEE